MTELEDLVRRALRHQVTDPPALAEPAERAAGGARTVRRRRLLLGMCAAALVLVAGAVGLGALHRTTRITPAPPATGHPTPVPSLSAAPAGAALLLPDDRQALVLPDGTRRAPGADTVIVAAVEIRQGWLVTTTVPSPSPADSAALLLFLRAGGVLPLRQGLLDPPALAADGTHLAFRTADQLYFAHLDGQNRLTTDAQTPMSGTGRPIAVTDRAVVLGATRTGGGIDEYDVWVPARGNYVPSWNAISHVAALSGPVPGGPLVLGLVYPTAGGNDTCLAELDPLNGLHPVRQACGLPLRPEPAGTVSLDGRWFVAPAKAGGLALIDLNRVFDQPAITASWSADRPGVWVSADTMIAPAGGGLRRYTAPHTTSDPVVVPGLPSGADVALVPRAVSG